MAGDFSVQNFISFVAYPSALCNENGVFCGEEKKRKKKKEEEKKSIIVANKNGETVSRKT